MDETGAAWQELTTTETIEEKEMTKQSGIFYMMYEAKKAAGYTIFNSDGNFLYYSILTEKTRGFSDLMSCVSFSVDTPTYVYIYAYIDI